MIRPLLVASFVLIASSVSAQHVSRIPGCNDPAFPGSCGSDPSLPTFDIAGLGLGPVMPWQIETDGNINTTEWAFIANSGVYLFDPASKCIELLTFSTPEVPGNYMYHWVWTLVRIAPDPRHQVLVWDIDSTDGKMPVALPQPVVYKKCR